MWVMRIVGACAVAALVGAAPVRAQTNPPSQEPQLRIDQGMHTASIRRIGVDASCKLLATGSHDKTVRLWGLPEGKLIDRKSTRLNSSHLGISYAVFCLKK